MEKKIQSSWKYIPESVNNLGLEEGVWLVLGRSKSPRHFPTIVFGHAIFPLEKIGDRLRLNADFDAPEAGEQQVHLVTETTCGAKICGGTMGH